MSCLAYPITSLPASAAGQPRHAVKQVSSQCSFARRRGKLSAHRLAVTAASSAAFAGSGGEDAGSAFLQQFKGLSSLVPQPASTSGSGCCGGSSSASADSNQTESASGCCGGSGGGSGAAAAAVAGAGSQLNALMAGMEGSLSRDDIRSAFEASRPASQEPADGGERFLDVGAILSGQHRADFADDHDDELDALVV